MNAIVFAPVFFSLLVVIWGIESRFRFETAKKNYLSDPSNPETKRKLLEAAKARLDRGRSGIEALTLIEAQREMAKDQNLVRNPLAVELKSLSDLHERGSLTDEEFELAKKLLLRS